MSKVSSGIQGQLLEVNVVGCKGLSNKEWFGRQDPYIIVEYANKRFRTRTDTDGGKNPTFNEKFHIPLIEGLRELSIHVWNSNTVSVDDHIGSTNVSLDKVLFSGYDNTPWQLKSKNGRTSGEVNLILHFAGKGKKDDRPGAVPSPYPPAMTGYPATTPPPVYNSSPAYPPVAPTYPAHQTGYPPSAYPPSQGYPPLSGYPLPPVASPYSAGYPPSSGYPPAGYPPGPAPGPAPGYPPAATYPAAYPASSGYPPSSSYPAGPSQQGPPGGSTVSEKLRH